MTTLREAAQQALDWLYDNGILHPTKVSEDLRTALAQQDAPLNLADPAVRKRLATQWGYVPAAQESVPAAVVGTQSDLWRGYNGQWAPPGEPIKMVQMLRDLPTGTLLYTAPPKAEPVEPVEPVAWMFESERNFNLVGYGGWEKRITECRPNALQSSVRNVTPLYTAPPQRLPLTDEEILKAIGWERAEMYMKLTPNFPVAEAKKETLKNARAVERAHGIGEIQ